MRSFAFITCPKTIKELKKLWATIRIVPDFIARPIFGNNRALKVFRIRNIHSGQGKEIQGYFMVCPLLEMPESKEDLILERITEAGHFAERLGVNILGLDNYLPHLKSDKEVALAHRLKIPLTNGSSLSAWSIIEAIYRISRIKKIDLKNSNVAIVGATGSIGKLCAKKIADYAKKIFINGAYPEKLERLKKSILNFSTAEVIIEEDPLKLARDADIIIIAGYLSEMQNMLEALRPGAIACNIWGQNNIASNTTLTGAGLIKLPCPINLKLNTGLPEDVVSAAFAETMLLTFEEKFVNYSLGNNINPDKLEEIADIAVRHGFEVWVPQAPVL